MCADATGSGGDCLEAVLNLLGLLDELFQKFGRMTAGTGFQNNPLQSVQILLQGFGQQGSQIASSLAGGPGQILQHFSFGIPRGRGQ